MSSRRTITAGFSTGASVAAFIYASCPILGSPKTCSELRFVMSDAYSSLSSGSLQCCSSVWHNSTAYGPVSHTQIKSNPRLRRISSAEFIKAVLQFSPRLGLIHVLETSPKDQNSTAQARESRDSRIYGFGICLNEN